MNKEIYRSINNLWCISLVIGIWALCAYIINFFDLLNVESWHELYPVVFPFALVLFIFGFVITSNYKICVKLGWIEIVENPNIKNSEVDK